MLQLLPVYGVLHVLTSASQVLGMTSVTLNGVTDTLTPEHEKYAAALETAADSFREADALFKDDSFLKRFGWKEDGENTEGDVVYSKMTPRGKMVTISTTLTGHVDVVMNETWTGISGLPEWNPNINYAKTIVTLNEHADIVTYGNNDILVVSGRDFVSARIWRPMPAGGYVMTSKSVELPEYPAQKGKVRANLYLAAVWFRPDPSSPADKTLCDVVMLVDLKGLLPKLVVNQVIPKIMLMDTEQNKKHFIKLAEKTTAATPGSK